MHGCPCDVFLGGLTPKHSYFLCQKAGKTSILALVKWTYPWMCLYADIRRGSSQKPLTPAAGRGPDPGEPCSHTPPSLLPFCAKGCVSEIPSWGGGPTSLVSLRSPLPIKSVIQWLSLSLVHVHMSLRELSVLKDPAHKVWYKTLCLLHSPLGQPVRNSPVIYQRSSWDLTNKAAYHNLPRDSLNPYGYCFLSLEY